MKLGGVGNDHGCTDKYTSHVAHSWDRGCVERTRRWCSGLNGIADLYLGFDIAAVLLLCSGLLLDNMDRSGTQLSRSTGKRFNRLDSGCWNEAVATHHEWSSHLRELGSSTDPAFAARMMCEYSQRIDRPLEGQEMVHERSLQHGYHMCRNVIDDAFPCGCEFGNEGEGFVAEVRRDRKRLGRGLVEETNRCIAL